jgi:hypothetical protein
MDTCAIGTDTCGVRGKRALFDLHLLLYKTTCMHLQAPTAENSTIA